MKKCTICGRKLSPNEFNKNSKAKDGLHSYCKQCQSDKRKKYYQGHKEEERLKRSEWRKKNLDRDREANRKWIKNNPEKYKEIWQRTNRQYKEKVLSIVGDGKLKCARCGCDKIEFLEVNHQNGGGAQEYKHGGNNKKMYAMIVSGERGTEDLNILCKPCNNLHYLELKFGPQPYEIIWKGMEANE